MLMSEDIITYLEKVETYRNIENKSICEFRFKVSDIKSKEIQEMIETKLITETIIYIRNNGKLFVKTTDNKDLYDIVDDNETFKIFKARYKPYDIALIQLSNAIVEYSAQEIQEHFIKETVITRQTNIRNELYQLSLLEEKATKNLKLQSSMIYDFDNRGKTIKGNIFESTDFMKVISKFVECIFGFVSLNLEISIRKLKTDINLIIDNKGLLNILVDSEGVEGAKIEGVKTVLYTLNSKKFDKNIHRNMLNTIEIHKLEYTKTVIDLLSRSLQEQEL